MKLFNSLFTILIISLVTLSSGCRSKDSSDTVTKSDNTSSPAPSKKESDSHNLDNQINNQKESWVYKRFYPGMSTEEYIYLWQELKNTKNHSLNEVDNKELQYMPNFKELNSLDKFIVSHRFITTVSIPGNSPLFFEMYYPGQKNYIELRSKTETQYNHFTPYDSEERYHNMQKDQMDKTAFALLDLFEHKYGPGEHPNKPEQIQAIPIESIPNFRQDNTEHKPIHGLSSGSHIFKKDNKIVFVDVISPQPLEPSLNGCKTHISCCDFTTSYHIYIRYYTQKSFKRQQNFEKESNRVSKEKETKRLLDNQLKQEKEEQEQKNAMMENI